MIAFLKNLLAVLLEVLPGLRAWKRSKERKAFREAAVKGDAAEMNRLWKEMEDRQ